MKHAEDWQRAMQAVINDLRERLSRLSQASLRIAGDLDLDTVLQETVDGARYGVLDDRGQVTPSPPLQLQEQTRLAPNPTLEIMDATISNGLTQTTFRFSTSPLAVLLQPDGGNIL